MSQNKTILQPYELPMISKNCSNNLQAYKSSYWLYYKYHDNVLSKNVYYLIRLPSHGIVYSSASKIASRLAFISFGLRCSLHSVQTKPSSLYLAILTVLLKIIREILSHHKHHFSKKKSSILLIIGLLRLEMPYEIPFLLLNLNLFIL